MSEENDHMCECGKIISEAEWDMFGGKCEECAIEEVSDENI